MYRVISGYTFATPYEQEIKDLEAGLKRFGIPYKFYGYHSTGDWTRNTMQKANIFMWAMHEYPDEDILWIDADALVKAPLTFFDNLREDADISFRYHPNPRIGKELLSGTLFIRNNEVGRKLVDAWKNVTDVDWDQKILQRLVEGEFADLLSIEPLPEEYVKINPRNLPVQRLKCVIGHKQFSRNIRQGRVKL